MLLYSASAEVWTNVVMQERGSALIVFGHAQELGGHLGHLRCPRVLKADAGQFSEIVFHALGSAVVLRVRGFTPISS